MLNIIHKKLLYWLWKYFSLNVSYHTPAFRSPLHLIHSIFNPIRILSCLISLRFLMKKVEKRLYAVQNSLELTCNDSCDECASQNSHFIENILNSIEIIFFAFFILLVVFGGFDRKLRCKKSRAPRL